MREEEPVPDTILNDVGIVLSWAKYDTRVRFMVIDGISELSAGYWADPISNEDLRKAVVTRWREGSGLRAFIKDTEHAALHARDFAGITPGRLEYIRAFMQGWIAGRR